MRIDLAGFGPGAEEMVTRQVREAISDAEVIIASARLAEYLQCLHEWKEEGSGDVRIEEWNAADSDDVRIQERNADVSGNAEIEDRKISEQMPGNVTAKCIIETSPRSMCRIIEGLSCERVLCLFGGDSSFYSGAAPVLALIRQSALLKERGATVRMLPGISSLSYACAKLGVSFREVEVFSAHGRDCDIVRAVMNGKKSFFLTEGSSASGSGKKLMAGSQASGSGKTLFSGSPAAECEDAPLRRRPADGSRKDPAQLCRALVSAGLGFLRVTVCEMLSTNQERIRTMTAEEAAGLEYLPLSVMLAEAAPVSGYLRRSVPGIADDVFVRSLPDASRRIPMTKRMVRVSALSLLAPGEDDLCWDLGAGCGSVSVELAGKCRRVISVEKDAAALRMMEENRKRFGAWNMEIVKGEIPQILSALPMPDRIFIGGGGGQIREILNRIRDILPEEAPHMGTRPVIVAAAITMETLHEVTAELEADEYGTQVMQVAVTDVKKRGHFHMMDAQNPVFLIAGYPEGWSMETMGYQH